MNTDGVKDQQACGTEPANRTEHHQSGEELYVVSICPSHLPSFAHGHGPIVMEPSDQCRSQFQLTVLRPFITDCLIHSCVKWPPRL